MAEKYKSWFLGLFGGWNFNTEDSGSVASKTLVSNHQTTQCNNPEHHNFYFSTVKTFNYVPSYSLFNIKLSVL